MIARRLSPPGPEIETPMESVLSQLETGRSFSIVQVGAYIGDTDNDPLYEWLKATLPSHEGSTVVLIEPVAEYFEQLRSAYAGMPVHLENVAITDEAGERDFYRLGVDPVAHGQPAGLSQVGSLRADRMTMPWDGWDVERGMQKFWLQHRVVEKVRCDTLQAVLDRHNLANIDLLQIDAEGYDYEILRTIDFQRIRPRFINYERVLLLEDEAACRAMMIAAGYVLVDWRQDTLCILPVAGDDHRA